MMMEAQFLLTIQNEFQGSALHSPAQMTNPTTQWRPWKSVDLQNVLKHSATKLEIPGLSMKGKGCWGQIHWHTISSQEEFGERHRWICFSPTKQPFRELPLAPDTQEPYGLPFPPKQIIFDFCINTHPIILQLLHLPKPQSDPLGQSRSTEVPCLSGCLAQKAPWPDGWILSTSYGRQNPSSPVGLSLKRTRE